MIGWLVETLIAASGLMLLVLAIRNPVRQAFGAKVAYALWLLPALRMVMPPVTAFMPPVAAFMPVPGVGEVPGALSEMIRARLVQLDVAPALPSESGAAFPWALVLAGVWLAGALAFALWQVVAYRRFTRHVLETARVRRSPARGVKLLASPRVKGPLAFGLRKRFIVFPHDALMRFDVEEHAMALAHELAHHRRGDLFANALALGVLALHWCNPIAWIAHRAFRADQEMACDADVIDAIRDQGLGHAYGRALVKCASGREFSAICHLTTVDRLKRRLTMLSKKSPSARRRFAGLALTGALLLSGLALTASGESMAAQVGAKVSEALPIPRKADLLPSLPAVPAALSAVDDAEAWTLEGHADHLAHAVERAVREVDLPESAISPAPPAHPPVPPAPPAVASPAPTVSPAPPSILAASRARAIARVQRDHARDIPSEADIQAMVPIVEVTEGGGCAVTGAFANTSEETVTVDGHERRKISVQICSRDIARHAREQALSGLQQARAQLVREQDLARRDRDRVIADLDRQIARLRARTD